MTFIKPSGNLEWRAPTLEERIKEGDLCRQIRELLAPFVLPLARQNYKRILTDAKRMPPLLTKGEVHNLLAEAGITKKMLKKIAGALEKQAKEAGAINNENLEEAIERSEVEYALDELMGFWIDILLIRETRDETKLCVSSLGDDMLPMDEPLLNEALLSAAHATVLTPDDFRLVLRSVKQSLPAGSVLPDAMLELLKMNGITLI